jgi:hypothetical protein
VRSEVLMALTGEYIFWDVGPCNLVVINQSFNEISTASTFGKRVIVCSFETLINVLKL